MESPPTREEAFELVRRHNTREGLVKHALAVEGVMRYFARKYGEDEDQWGVIGLVHDLDWEQYPDQHCAKTEEILNQHGWPKEYIRAVKSHGWKIVNDVEPKSLLEKTLYAVDEMTGFVTACALVRPSKSVMDLELKSIKKKWKQKEFAAGVDRGVVEEGAEMLGLSLDDLTSDVILGMREIADDLGLA